MINYNRVTINNPTDREMKLMTAEEVAKYITERDGEPISVREVQRELRLGYIKGELIGGTYIVKESALKNYARRSPGRPKKIRR